MAIHASARKAARQSVKHREANRAVRSNCWGMMSEVRKLIAEPKKDAAKIKEQLKLLESKFMKAASKGIFKQKTVSRYISRLSSAAAR